MAGNTERGQFEDVAEAIYEAGCIQFGSFVLKDKPISPIYINLRKLRSFPGQKGIVVDAYASLLNEIEKPDLLADIPTAATPLVSSLSDRLFIPQITPRMDEKSYGSGAKIDGVYEPGQTAAVFDDLITTSKSKLEAIAILKEAGLKVADVFVLIDREQGGRAQLTEAGYNLHAYTTLPHLLQYYVRAGLVTAEQFETTMAYLGIK